MTNGLRSSRRKAPYTKESILRALMHHEATGAIFTYSPPDGGSQDRWRVHLPGFDTVELTTPQVYALCLGLAAGERAYKPKESCDDGDAP